ncbi:RidA family protein [Amycolatopsis nigrescens]|uniref:RidA family protein n=1 Tax=Amycolatopsis nigrescens TaxID=381445 RepID=UPI0003736405|nr:RidA family protein [Amycolatopsis nigrescens]
MIIERDNPAGLHSTPGYHHVTTVESRRLVFLAGQCPLAADGQVVPGGLGAQTDQIVANTLTALRSAGAAPEQVVRTVIYVASSVGEELAEVWARLNDSALAPAFSTASTLLGVAALGFPEQLVELDVTAALD